MKPRKVRASEDGKVIERTKYNITFCTVRLRHYNVVYILLAFNTIELCEQRPGESGG